MRLYWDVQRNVPVVSSECIESELRVIPTSKMSDPRPAFEWDLELLRSVVDEQFGSGAFRELIRSEVVLFGRAPYLDTAYEVISDGGVLGHLFFDVYEMRWYFKPLEPSIERIGHRMEYLRFEGRRGDVVGDAEGGPKFKLIDNGLIERVNGRYVVVREFKPRDPLIEERSGWKEVLGVNEPCVMADEFRAIRFIWRIARRSDKLIVSFSGGKDSSVLLRIVERSDVPYVIYFNDTGLELPETLQFIDEVGYDIKGDAGDSFWRNVKGFGPPARDYRWCCKLIKLLPTYRTLKRIAPGITLVGQRRFESSSRMRNPPIWRNKWLPGFLTGAPINDWSALEIWLYIGLRSLKVNPLYYNGFERLGCFLCPASRLSEFKRIEEIYPDLWGAWSSFLREYASQRGLRDCWIRYGLWRWINPPFRTRFLCPSEERKLVSVKLREGEMKISPFYPDDFLSLANTVGEVRGNRILGDGFHAEVRRDGLKYRGEGRKLLGIVARSSACTGCGLCEEYCEFGALRVEGKARVLPDRCRRCGTCNEVCPLSFYSNKVVEVSPDEF